MKREAFGEMFCALADKKPLKTKENHDIMCFTGKGVPMCAAPVKRKEFL